MPGAYEPKSTSVSRRGAYAPKEPVILQPLFRVVTDVKNGSDRVPTDDPRLSRVKVPDTWKYGNASTRHFENVDLKTEAKVGDVLEITYRMKIPVLENWQRDYVVSKISKDPRFRLIEVSEVQEPGKLRVVVELLQPFSPVLIVAAAILAALVGAAIFTSIEGVRRQVMGQESGGIGTTAGIGFITLLLLGVGGYFLTRTLRA